MKKEKLPIGTKVRITGNSNNHGLRIGKIVTIDGNGDYKTDAPGYNLYYCDGTYVRDYDFEVVDEDQMLLDKAYKDYTIGVKFKSYDDDGRIRKVKPYMSWYGKSEREVTYEIDSDGNVRCDSGMYTTGEDGEHVCSNPIVYRKETNEWMEIVKEETTSNNMTHTQTVTRKQLQTLHKLVCSKWQRIIEDTIKSDVFADSYEVKNTLINEAFKEADAYQIEALLKVFKKPYGEYVQLVDDTTSDFKTNVFNNEDIVLGKGAVKSEFRGKSIIFDSSKYEVVVMKNEAYEMLDMMIVFKEK